MDWITDYYKGMEFPYFDEKKIDECVDLLRYVYKNYSKTKRKTRRLKKLISKKFRLDQSIDRAGNRLLQLEI